MNHERLVIGLATVFGQPSRNEGTVWYAEDFADFIASGPGTPMHWGHPRQGDLCIPDVGFWRAYAAVPPEGDRPAGLLALGEVRQSRDGESLLAALREGVEPWRHDGLTWGLSVREADVSRPASDDGDGSRRWLKDVSVVREPAFEKALVMGVGTHAAAVWRTLTQTEPPYVPATTPRTVRRRLQGVYTDGRIIWTDD